MVIINPLMPPNLSVGTIPNVVPFTMRENYSQMGLVEGMRDWITNDLVPFVNGNIDKLSTEWVEAANKLIADFETITTGLVSDVNEAVEDVNQTAVEVEAARAAAVAARNEAEQFASDAQDVQDAAVTTILSDTDSTFRVALDGLYASAVGLSNLSTTVTTLQSTVAGKADTSAVNAKNASQDDAITSVGTLAASKADGSVQSTVESGRLSAAEMGATWATKAEQDSLSSEVALIPRDGMAMLVPGKRFKTMAGTIRRVNQNAWEFINDDNHTPVGVQSISVTDTYVQVVADFQGKTVTTVSITPDEAFSQAAVRVGGSVGLYFIRIYFYMGAGGSAPVNPRLLSAEGANVWIYAVWEVE